jgi:hypothetical protein
VGTDRDHRSLKRLDRARYVNFLGDADGTRSAYGADTYARLAALKSEYDPTNLFKLNHNIAPSR